MSEGQRLRVLLVEDEFLLCGMLAEVLAERRVDIAHGDAEELRLRADDLEAHHGHRVAERRVDARELGPLLARCDELLADLAELGEADALRVLELTGTPSLDVVRAKYGELSRRYYPKTKSSSWSSPR